MSIELDLDLAVSLKESLTREHDFRKRQADSLYQKPLDPLQVPLDGSGDGTLDEPLQMGPVRGFMWSVRRLTFSGWTTGTVTAYINNLEPIPVPQAGMYKFGRGELLLASGDRLTVVASGVSGGYVQVNGAADVFETWYLPYYIG